MMSTELVTSPSRCDLCKHKQLALNLQVDRHWLGNKASYSAYR